MEEIGAADRFLTALAALELLADSAHQRPQLVIVDDAQWLDTPTVEALVFIARRITAEPVVLIIAVRAGDPGTVTELTGAHLPQIDLEPLDDDSVSDLSVCDADRPASGARALAGALRAYPDRRAWHLAASAIAPDDPVAGEIADAAARAEAQGALTVAIDAFARSAALSADDGQRARRLLHAADLGFSDRRAG